MDSLSKDKEALESTISVQEKPITYEIVKSYLCQFFKLDNTIKNRRLLVDLFIKKIIIYDNDDIVIICKSHNKSLKTKNEHSNDEMFIFNRFGATYENRTHTGNPIRPSNVRVYQFRQGCIAQLLYIIKRLKINKKLHLNIKMQLIKIKIYLYQMMINIF